MPDCKCSTNYTQCAESDKICWNATQSPVIQTMVYAQKSMLVTWQYDTLPWARYRARSRACVLACSSMSHRTNSTGHNNQLNRLHVCSTMMGHKSCHSWPINLVRWGLRQFPRKLKMFPWKTHLLGQWNIFGRAREQAVLHRKWCMA